ncbi:MAG: hypothetical protein H0T61_00450 [Actinobacteria bacterium]|nr:hypothetical protein [Actinomycetota bacterium]
MRLFVPGPRRHEGAGECPRCAYVGWAFAAKPSERAGRRLLRLTRIRTV